METSITVPELKELQEAAAPIVMRAEALEIATKEQHEGGLFLLKGIRVGKKGIKEMLDPLCKKANDLHKSLTWLRKEALKSWDHAEDITTGKLDTYEREQQRIADEAAAEAQAEAEALEEDRQLAEAAEAQDAGDHKAAEEIVSRPIEAPIVESRPDVAKMKGVSARTSYKVQVVDVVMLAKHVVDNPQWQNLIMGNMTVLNGLARSQQQAFNVPGCRLVKDTVRSVRTS